jgi:hypothetical protein
MKQNIYFRLFIQAVKGPSGYLWNPDVAVIGVKDKKKGKAVPVTGRGGPIVAHTFSIKYGHRWR